VKATFHVAVKAVRHRWYADTITELRAVRLTKKKPALAADEIAVKLTLDIPTEAFEAFAPEATITIPADLLATPDVHVEVEEPE
jgi:hypothetical protein